MLFTHIFHLFEVKVIGVVKKKPKESKEYNKKTQRLMGFVEDEDSI